MCVDGLVAWRERGWGQTNEDREGFIWTQTGNGIVVLNRQLMVRDRRDLSPLGLARDLGEVDVEDGSAMWVPWSVGEGSALTAQRGWRVGTGCQRELHARWLASGVGLAVFFCLKPFSIFLPAKQFKTKSKQHQI